MAVGVPEVDSSPATVGVDLPILQGAWPALIRNAGGLDAVEDRIKLGLADVKGVVVTLEPVAIVEVQGQGWEQSTRLLAAEVMPRLADLTGV